jgi:hypothetical protein
VPSPLDGLNLTPRQRAWHGENPEKYKYFKPKLSRKELGSFATPSFAAAFDAEVRARWGWGGRWGIPADRRTHSRAPLAAAGPPAVAPRAAPAAPNIAQTARRYVALPCPFPALPACLQSELYPNMPRVPMYNLREMLPEMLEQPAGELHF